MSKIFFIQARAILQELFFICCLTRGIWFTPWFPYINKIFSTPFVFLQGIKKGLLKHPFLVQIYFSTTLIILFIQLLFWEPIFIISIPSWTSRTVRYCLVYFHRVSNIEMNHLRIRINDFVNSRLDWLYSSDILRRQQKVVPSSTYNLTLLSNVK